MGTLHWILASVVLLTFSVNGSEILRICMHFKNKSLNTTLDELLANNEFASALFFNENGRIRRSGRQTLSALLEFSHLMSIFLIGCKKPINKDDCSKYGYTSPELRFFPNKFNRTNSTANNTPGLKVPVNPQMTEVILNELANLTLNVSGAPTYKPIHENDTIASLFRQAKHNRITHLVLVGQSKKNSTLGRSTIVSLLSRGDVMVRIVDNYLYFRNFGLKYASDDRILVIIPRASRRVIPLYPKKANESDFAEAVEKFLEQPVS